MIRTEHHEGALRALHATLIRARAMSYKCAEAELAALLDNIEYLVCLILSTRDETETFRAFIKEIAERFQCAWALQQLDAAASASVAPLDAARGVGGSETMADAIEILHAYVRGHVRVDVFAKRFTSIWHALRNSGGLANEPVHVQRGLDVVFTSIDQFETDCVKGTAMASRESILFAEARAILSVLSS